MAPPEQHDLTMIRDFAAPQTMVWQAWTDPAHFARWWGPSGVTSADAEIDLRPGGSWRAVMHSVSGSDFASHGTFQVVEPESRLVTTFTWEWDAGTEMELTVELETLADVTRMTFTHRGLGSVEDRDGHHFGWVESFDKLARMLTPHRAAEVVGAA